jgi:hypothetical protein
LGLRELGVVFVGRLRWFLVGLGGPIRKSLLSRALLGLLRVVDWGEVLFWGWEREGLSGLRFLEVRC